MERRLGGSIPRGKIMSRKSRHNVCNFSCSSDWLSRRSKNIFGVHRLSSGNQPRKPRRFTITPWKTNTGYFNSSFPIAKNCSSFLPETPGIFKKISLAFFVRLLTLLLVVKSALFHADNRANVMDRKARFEALHPSVSGLAAGSRKINSNKTRERKSSATYFWV